MKQGPVKQREESSGREESSRKRNLAKFGRVSSSVLCSGSDGEEQRAHYQREANIHVRASGRVEHCGN